MWFWNNNYYLVRGIRPCQLCSELILGRFKGADRVLGMELGLTMPKTNATPGRIVEIVDCMPPLVPYLGGSLLIMAVLFSHVPH